MLRFLLCDIVWYGVCLSCQSCCPASFLQERMGEASEQPFRSPSHRVLLSCKLLRFGGGSHGGETLASLGTMVPQDDSPRGGAAHGPRHPSCF